MGSIFHLTRVSPPRTSVFSFSSSSSSSAAAAAAVAAAEAQSRVDRSRQFQLGNLDIPNHVP